MTALEEHQPDRLHTTATLWTAVHALTRPSKLAVPRDDGTVVWGIVPSLWDQACAAWQTDRLSGEGHRSVSSERSLVDFELMEVCALIADTTRHTLHRFGLVPRESTPGQLGQLAGHVVSNDPERLWWWEYRFTSWARMLGNYLGTLERQPSPLRLRNSRCPCCQVAQVVVETESGPVVAPALVIDFREGFVRAAQCSACGVMWWRGADLEQLAALLGGAPL